jgi:Golgi phosphoprotein 3 (GPP34)
MAIAPDQWDQPTAGQGLYPATSANGHFSGGSMHRGPRHAAWDAANTRQYPVGRQAPAPQRSGRESWPLIADDLFLVIGDDRGKLRVNRDVAQIGLAGALLAELIHSGYATIVRNDLTATRGGEPIDRLAGAVIRQVRAEKVELPVRKWIAFLATTSLRAGPLYDNVGYRLTRAGRVTRTERGVLWRRSTLYVPSDTNDAGWAWARISSALSGGHALSPTDVTFAGLLLATGLHRYVLLGDGKQIEHQIRSYLADAGPDIGALIQHTEDAVNSAVMTSN